MSAVKFEFEDAIKEGGTFGEWVVENFIWAESGPRTPLPDIEVADKLLDQEKQAIYEFILAGKKADEELEVNFPEPSGLIDKLLKLEGAEQVKVQDVDKASAEGLTAGQNPESDLLDNPYVKFNKPLWRTWRLYFIKGRKGPEKQAEPVDPGLTMQQQRMLQVDAELVSLNPKVRAAQHLVDTLKDDLKEAKSDLDSLLEEQAELCNKLSIISEGGSYQPNLPFDDDLPHPDVEAGKHRPHGTPLMDATAKAMKVDPAIKAAIHELGNEEIVGDLALTETVIDKLMDNGIQYIGDLEQRIKQAAIGNYSWHKDLSKIGPGTATKIEDAREAWRRINPVPNPEDDEPEEVEATTEEADEEPDTIPMNIELEWWCSECDHTWPIDGDNDQCPECENETGNQKVGYQGCPDANEHGVIVRNYEEVVVVDHKRMKCIVRLYENTSGLWQTSITLEDPDFGYAYSDDLCLTDNGSTSRDAALKNILINTYETKDIGNEFGEDILKYVDLHLKSTAGDEFECMSCKNCYTFDSGAFDQVHCPFCGAVEHTPVA